MELRKQSGPAGLHYFAEGSLVHARATLSEAIKITNDQQFMELQKQHLCVGPPWDFPFHGQNITDVASGLIGEFDEYTALSSKKPFFF